MRRWGAAVAVGAVALLVLLGACDDQTTSSASVTAPGAGRPAGSVWTAAMQGAAEQYLAVHPQPQRKWPHGIVLASGMSQGGSWYAVVISTKGTISTLSACDEDTALNLLTSPGDYIAWHYGNGECESPDIGAAGGDVHVLVKGAIGS